jgi:tripartite-type tricarboxylate transporter receptor subunit TctC
VFPDVPSVGEFLPGYEANVWFGIGAPRQTPGDIVERLNREINAGLNDPTLRGRLDQFGGTPLTGTPAEFEKRFVADSEKWAKVIREANIKS